MSNSDNSSKNQSTKDSSSNRVVLLEEQLAEARRQLAQKEKTFDQLQAAHAKEIGELELERDQIIHSLMESEERYRIHISTTTAMIWHGNAVGHFSVPQDSWRDYTGQVWPEHRTIGWMQMLPHNTRDSFAQEWLRLIEVGKTFKIECQIWSEIHEDYRHCEMNSIPMHDNTHGHGVSAWVGSVLDIHEQKLDKERILSTNELLVETVAELQRSNTELDRFVYIASHDLKEPLRGMQNLATMLIDLYQDQLDEDGLELLSIMYESGDRMQQLINDLHKYSRVRLTTEGLQNVNTDVLLDEIIMGLRALPERREFKISRTSALPNLLCNPVHLKTVFQNLLSNALKYGDRESAMIEVGVVDSADNVEEPLFYVRDNGIGLKDEHHQLIFDMFKRLHAEDAYGSGTGAGLALAKKILEQYGGRIWVESTFGVGSTFYFSFGSENKSKERFVIEKEVA